MNWLRLHVSNLCNFKCPNCHVFELAENNLPNQNMSSDVFDSTVLTFLNHLKNINQSSVTISLYGGETLANKKLIKEKILFYSHNHLGIDLNWILNTNGSLLELEDVQFFKTNNVEIHISVDGPEQIHNLSRPTHQGKGTFHLVMPALESIKNLKPKAQINSYLMPTNIDYLKDIIDIAVQYNIEKIYLDQLYDNNMHSHLVGLEKYREAYIYSLAKGVTLNGPWKRVLENYQRNSFRVDSLKKDITIDVNIDGSFYFSQSPETKSSPIHSSKLKYFLENNYVEMIENAVTNFEKACSSCPIKNECFGLAITQVKYHIGPLAKPDVSCDFFRDWMQFLNRPIHYKENDRIKVLSVFPLNDCNELITTIENELSFLESKLWSMNKKINLHIVEYFDELKYASKQYKLPNWAKATACDYSTIIHLGKIPAHGLRHELVHLFLEHLNLNLPKFIQEGLAEWFAKPKPPPHGYKPKFKFEDINDFDLIDLDNRHLEINESYKCAHAFIAYLIHHFGEEKLIKLLELCNKNNFNSILINHTGIDLSSHYLNYQLFEW